MRDHFTFKPQPSAAEEYCVKEEKKPSLKNSLLNSQNQISDRKAQSDP